MSIFKYNLPSGADFTLTAPADTTQAEADKIFYSQVAAGTFVGYNVGDTLTTPIEALNNFGLSRLQRGTAGIDDKTLLSVISGLPIVPTLPALSSIPVSNAITQVDYATVVSDPINGVYSLGPSAIGTGPNAVKTPISSGSVNSPAVLAVNGSTITISRPAIGTNTSTGVLTFSNGITAFVNPGGINGSTTVILSESNPGIVVGSTVSDSLGLLSSNTSNASVRSNNGAGQLKPQQMQAIMAQVAAIVNQDASVMTQTSGIGKYGFNAQQLENAGYIKPGFSQRYPTSNPSSQSNSDNFTCIMSSPTPWTGLDGVSSVNDILRNPSLQNKIQEKLMNQGYSSMVASGVIVPPTSSVSVPTVSTGKVYTANGTLSEAGALSLLNTPARSVATHPVELSTSVGTTPNAINKLGANAVAQYNAGLSTLSSGAVGFGKHSTGGVSQLAGLASSPASSATSLTASITSALNGDIGALVANSSKYGVSLTLGWAQGSGSLSNLNAGAAGALNINSGAINNINNLNVSGLTNGLNSGGLSGVNTQALASVNISNALAGPALSKLNALAKSAQFGVNFSDFALSGLVSGVRPSPGFTNTVNRSTIDASVIRVIGSPLITPPVYGLPSNKSLGVVADINAAQNILSTVSVINTVQNALSQGTAAANVNINKFR